MSDSKQIDLRQLRILLTLLEERSVTRTAQVLEISQPYVSLALKRLRQATGDQILVRSGSKLVLTERGHSMIEPARKALTGIDQIIFEQPTFDPKTERGTFRIASADCMEALVLPRLVARIREDAPGSRIVLRAVDQAFDYASALENDELDALISNWSGAPKHLKTARLLSEKVVCMFAEDHPFAGKTKITIEDYLASQHIAPVARGKADPGPIESHLATQGMKRDIRVMVPEFNLIPYMLLSSNLVFTASRHFAEHFCSLLPLRSLPAPVECGELHFYLLWHERNHATPRSAWLRQHIMAAGKIL